MKLQCRNIYNNFISWRFIFIFGLILFLFLILIMRVFYLQLINPALLVHEGDMRSLRVRQINIMRGMIHDRVGRLLAVSVPVYAIWADPYELKKCINFLTDKRWQLLADVLSVSINQLSSRILLSLQDRFVYLARQVGESTAEYVLKLNLPGIYLRQEFKRYYPCVQTAAHIIGVTDIDGHGIEGVEKSFDVLLSGRPGERIVRQDRFGRVIENVSSTDSQDSNHIFLSIDKRLQTIVYHALHNAVRLNRAESGSAVLINISTGEVLAMANSPSYDPNNLSTANKQFIRNRSITDLFEPGSTVKPIVIMAALQQGIIKENSVLDTRPYMVNGHQVKDVVSHSTLSVKEILQKSSNVGVSKLALEMPYSVLIDAYLRFGIGKKTNLGLIGERSGSYLIKNRWSDIERAAFSYGYGLMVTPLQLAKAYATIGGMGMSRPLSIIRVDRPVLGKQIFSESLVRCVVNMMETVPISVSHIGLKQEFHIAIKTGTTKKVGVDGKYINKYVAYTAAIAPVNNPKFSLVIVINNPSAGQYYGRLVSTPVCYKIISDIIRIINLDRDILYPIS